MIIGISGFAGTGKDTASDFLVKHHGFVKVALADQMKRICKEVYDFSDEQLWGPSEERNKPDKRYPRELHEWDESTPPKCKCCGHRLEPVGPYPQCYLTPRFALQLLGSEFGRACYPDIWMEYGLRVAKTLLGHFEEKYLTAYTAQKGLHRAMLGDVRPKGVVFSDIRFKNEIRSIKQSGGKTVRLKRTGFEKPTWNHVSELEQTTILDEEFDYILNNTGDLHFLKLMADQMMDVFHGRLLPYDKSQEDVPPFQRK